MHKGGGLVRDIAIRGYAAHVLTYEGLRRDPERHVTEVLTWIGHGDPREATQVVRAPAANAAAEVSSDRSDAELSDGIDPRHLRVFDDLYATLDAERPLTQALVDALNHTDDALRPLVLEHRARIQAQAVAELHA